MSKVLYLEKFIFFAFIFSLPFQKRIFLFGPAAAGDGFFEWSSGFLYFTDFLILILFALWFVRCGRSDLPHRLSGIPALLLVFLAFAFVSLTQAELIDVGLYRFGKLAEFIFLFFYVLARARVIGIKPIFGVFVASGAFQSILAILQFAKQSSLGLTIFHESTLQIGLQGVAQITAQGIDMVRAYGTFPSPNVLAGFLGLCLLFAFCLFFKGFTKGRDYSLAHSLMYGVAIFLLSFGILLTFSRGVIIFFVFATLLFFAGIFLLEQLRQYRKNALHVVLLVVGCWLLVAAFAWPEVSSRFGASSVSEPAIQERLFLNEVGVDTLKQNYTQLFFGVGIGNFVHQYMQSLPGLAPYLYQPAHNIFILIASEIGIAGLIVFIIFLTMVVKKFLRYFCARHYSHDRGNSVAVHSLFFAFFFLLLVGMYDHYFWTLQQGSLMFWIVLGLLASTARDYNKRL